MVLSTLAPDGDSSRPTILSRQWPYPHDPQLCGSPRLDPVNLCLGKPYGADAVHRHADRAPMMMAENNQADPHAPGKLVDNGKPKRMACRSFVADQDVGLLAAEGFQIFREDGVPLPEWDPLPPAVLVRHAAEHVRAAVEHGLVRRKPNVLLEHACQTGHVEPAHPDNPTMQVPSEMVLSQVVPESRRILLVVVGATWGRTPASGTAR
jgi:hypothetical protein